MEISKTNSHRGNDEKETGGKVKKYIPETEIFRRGGFL